MTLTELCETAPDPTHGRPAYITAHGETDWRLVVEMLLPDQAGAVVGTAVVGTTRVAAGLEWIDITDHVRGFETTRGSDAFGGNPETGVATITLASPADLFSPFNDRLSSFHGSGLMFRPGGLIRIGFVSPTLLDADEPYEWSHPDYATVYEDGRVGWFPMFTGLVESWPVSTVVGGVDGYVDVTITETTSLLANNDLPPGAAISSADAIIASDEYLTRAGFPYKYEGSFPFGKGPWTQGVIHITAAAHPDGSGYVLDNLRRNAEDNGLAFLSARTGVTEHRLVLARLGDVSFDSKPTPTRHHYPTGLILGVDGVPVVEDSITLATDDYAIINYADFDPDGPSGIASDPLSIERYGRRPIIITDSRAASISTRHAMAAATVARRANLYRRIDSLALDQRNGTAAGAMLAVDVLDEVTVKHRTKTSDLIVVADCRVRSVRHRYRIASPTAANWQTDLQLDTLTTTTELET